MVTWTSHSSMKPAWVSKWIDNAWSGLSLAVGLFPPSCKGPHGFSTSMVLVLLNQVLQAGATFLRIKLIKPNIPQNDLFS